MRWDLGEARNAGLWGVVGGLRQRGQNSVVDINGGLRQGVH